MRSSAGWHEQRHKEEQSENARQSVTNPEFLILLPLIHVSLHRENIKAAQGCMGTGGEDEVLLHLTITGFTVAFVVSEKKASYSM